MPRLATLRQRATRAAIAVVLASVATLLAACDGGGGGGVNPGAQSHRQLTAAEQQRLLVLARKYSHCMQTHDLPNFPNPTTGPQRSVSIRLGNANINTNSTQYRSAESACQALHAALDR